MSDRMPTTAEAEVLAAMEALVNDGNGEPYGGNEPGDGGALIDACEKAGWAAYYDGYWITDDGVAALGRYRASHREARP